MRTPKKKKKEEEHVELSFDYVFNAGVPPATAYALVLPALLDDLFLYRPASLMSTGGQEAVKWLLGSDGEAQLERISGSSGSGGGTRRGASRRGRTPGALCAMATAILDRTRRFEKARLQPLTLTLTLI